MCKIWMFLTISLSFFLIYHTIFLVAKMIFTIFSFDDCCRQGNRSVVDLVYFNKNIALPSIYVLMNSFLKVRVMVSALAFIKSVPMWRRQDEKIKSMTWRSSSLGEGNSKRKINPNLRAQACYHSIRMKSYLPHEKNSNSTMEHNDFEAC